MNKFVTSTLIAGLAIASLAAPLSQDMKMEGTVTVGGMSMFKMKNIVENAVNSKDHTTLVAAVKAAGLVDTLMSKGPFTVFAPVNSAFAALREGTVEMLLKEENKPTLTKILTYHVVAGRIDSAEMKRRIKMSGGKAMLKTVAGHSIWLSMNGPSNIIVTDESGNSANIPTYDVYQSNGVIHVIDKVLMSK